MTRELRIIAIAAATLIVSRALVLLIDNAVVAWRQRGLYES